MKKTSIYLLSICVICVLILSVIMPARRILTVGVESYNIAFGVEGKNKASEATDAENSNAPRAMIMMEFKPTASTMIHPKDSIAFSNGEVYPYVFERASILAPADRIPAWTILLALILSPLEILLDIFIMWKLIRFIVTVSKQQIFVSRNVKYLRQTSTALLLIALLQIIEGLCHDKIFSLYGFSWPGYELGAAWSFPWSCLIIGILGFLFAQVWAYGISIKEDQELTI